MNCFVCENDLFFEDEFSYLCNNCKILINKNAKNIDYSAGGGQAVPSENKRALRLENSKARFELLMPFLKENTFFVDIGCGSGEMLEVSKSCCTGHFGFDADGVLIEHCKSIGLNADCGNFDKDKIKMYKSQKLFSACHVIEHLNNPVGFVENVYEAMHKGDLFFVEVPLYSGLGFKKKGYSWSLWCDEHVALYSMEALAHIAKRFGFEIKESGFRNFISDSKNFGKLLKLSLRHPFRFLAGYMTKNSRQKIADNIIQDYGYMILEK